MSLKHQANCVLIIVRDYYISLGEALIKLHKLRGVPYKFPKSGPIVYKHRSLLHQCDKKGNFMSYVNSLTHLEIRDAMQLCVDHISPKSNGMNRALTDALGNDLKALNAEFSSYEKETISSFNFPKCPKCAIKCAKSIISEIDEIMVLYKTRMEEKSKQRHETTSVNTTDRKITNSSTTIERRAPIKPNIYRAILPPYMQVFHIFL